MCVFIGWVSSMVTVKASNRSLPPDEPPAALKTFLEEFKNLFAQLIELVCDQVQIASTLLPYRRRKAGV